MARKKPADKPTPPRRSTRDIVEGLGARLREIRIAVGMTTTTLAYHAGEGTGQSTISAIETESRAPSVKMLIRLADALGVSLDEFRKPVGSPIAFKPRG